MEIISPYKNLVQYTRIQLQPYHLNSDITDNMFSILQNKLEKKCNKYGFIDEIYQIIKHSDGIMLPENLSGNVTIEVDYSCRFCVPIENSAIICQIKSVNTDLIIAKNGPIIVFISRNNIDTNVWNIMNEIIHIKTNETLKINDFVKIFIIKKKINENDTQIKCIGNLLDYSTEDENIKYYNNLENNNSNNNFIL